MKRKLLAVVLAALMMLALMPVGALAQDLSARSGEAKRLAMLDDAWKAIEAAEAVSLAHKASPSETTLAAYKAAMNEPLIDRGSLKMTGEEKFSFTVDGMHCLYYYRARVQESAPEAKVEVFTPKTEGNWAQALDVLLVGPYYGVQSTFTDQYKEEAQSIADATGGTVTLLSGSAATGPAIAQNYPGKGVVIYDSHGTQDGDSSYLCLTTNSGITTTDYNNGWAVSSGDAAFIDGRYVQNHITETLSNCLVWMAICEGMKKSGNGTTGTALLAAGAGVVYGYSQSVSFSGDYEYEATFWNVMKDGGNVAEAFATMVSTHGQWDPAYSSSSGAAWPIVMSDDDPFPSNPDSAQTVYSDWTLFSQEPVALEGFNVANASGETVTSVSMAQGKRTNVKIVAEPLNANGYTVAWSIADTNVATVEPSANGKNAVITGVNIGSTTLTATVTTESKAVFTKTVGVTVTEAPKWYPTDEIVPGEDYLIGFVVGNETYLAVNYAPSASNHYYLSISSNYYGYTAPAIFNGEAIVGVSGYADDIDYCIWRFESEGTGHIYSGYQDGYYLQAYSGTSYADLHAGTDSNFTWTFDANARTLYTYTSATRYAQYVNNSGNNLMGVTGSVPTNGYVQLFSMTEPDPTAPVYTVTFKDWDGTVLKTEQVKEGKSAHAPADPTREGYVFAGWDTDFSAVMSDLVVTATYEVYVAPNYEWLPTDTIVPGEEYLIGFVVNGTTYLAVNYNPDASNHYYVSANSATYYGYTSPAVMMGEKVIGVSGNVNDLLYCSWTFSSESGGTIASVYNPNYILTTYTSTNYNDLYPQTTTTNYAWTYNASAHTLYRTISSTARYAGYVQVNGGDHMQVTSTVPDSTVQLFVKTETTPVEPTYYTVTFVDWDGTVLSTQEVAEGAAAVAPANPSRIGYTFVGWDVSFSNVTSNLTVTAQYELNLYQLVVYYQYEDGTEAAPTRYDLFFAYGEEYSIESPEIEGYTPDIAVVQGVMGNGTGHVTVTYYANEEPPVNLPGDVNCDGILTSADISALFAYIMNAGSLTDQGVINADVNGDGVITSADVTVLSQLIFG